MRAAPAARQPRWYSIPVRVLLITFILTLLSFAVSLLVAILGLVIVSRMRGVTPDLRIAYSHIALPVSLVAGAVVLVVLSVLEIHRYRQSRALAGIARASQ